MLVLSIFIWGYTYLSDTEAPKIPTNSKAPKNPTVFWLDSNISDRRKEKTFLVKIGLFGGLNSKKFYCIVWWNIFALKLNW